MKLVTYSKENKVSWGVLADDGIIDGRTLWQGEDAPKSVKHILSLGQSSLKKITESAKSADTFIPTDSVKLLAPIPKPGKLIALAGNYTEHIKEAGLSLGLSDSPQKTTVPRPFIMPSTAVIGPDETIPWPVYSDKIDYELELAVVIGKKAKCISPEVAQEYIAGYTIANDVSARSVTFKKGRANRPWDEFYDWLNGKWADGFLPLGPCIVTRDEIDDVQNLDMNLKVNGRVRQKANTSQMIFPVTKIVSFLSHIMTLEPSDIICTGTPAGVAAATGDFLKAGDKIECQIEKIGMLTNILGPKPKKLYTPLAE